MYTINQRAFGLLRICAIALVGCATVQMANATDSSTGRDRYRQEMAACDSPTVGSNRANCRREAENAYAEFKRGHLVNEHNMSEYQINALRRCEVHKGDDRQDCEARIRGDANIDGSVESGGILRESVRIVPTK